MKNVYSIVVGFDLLLKKMVLHYWIMFILVTRRDLTWMATLTVKTVEYGALQILMFFMNDHCTHVKLVFGVRFPGVT